MSNRRWKDTKDYPLSNARGQRNESKAMRAHVTIYPLDASGSAQISAPHYPTITFSPTVGPISLPSAQEIQPIVPLSSLDIWGTMSRNNYTYNGTSLACGFSG